MIIQFGSPCGGTGSQPCVAWDRGLFSKWNEGATTHQPGKGCPVQGGAAGIPGAQTKSGLLMESLSVFITRPLREGREHGQPRARLMVGAQQRLAAPPSFLYFIHHSFSEHLLYAGLCAGHCRPIDRTGFPPHGALYLAEETDGQTHSYTPNGGAGTET